MSPKVLPRLVYLEIGSRKVFAGALDWPGWCRSGRDELAALQALVDYAPRYARALNGFELFFKAPLDVSALDVVERLKGDSTTDFGAPGAAPAFDDRPLTHADHERLKKILSASWRAFGRAVEGGQGLELRKGPRGGGRELDAILAHIVESQNAYLGRVGRRPQEVDSTDLTAELDQVRAATLEALGAGLRGEIPERGPRGGLRWTARYFARRAAWHVLDHAWEIEDRIT